MDDFRVEQVDYDAKSKKVNIRVTARSGYSTEELQGAVDAAISRLMNSMKKLVPWWEEPVG